MGLIDLSVNLLDIDPRIVQPGWTPLIITVLLAGAIVLLYLSMRRQFRKISVPPASPSDPGPQPRSASSPTSPS
jgi:hypothetical protein